SPSATSLRAHLAGKLPEYMVPSAFVRLEKLPLTAHGKVDRKALPAPDGSRPEVGTGYLPPRTPVEQILADIWGEVLGLERVGIDDNFFDLGGDSILTIRVQAKAREKGLELTIQQIFRHQTIRRLGEAAAPASASSPGEVKRSAFSLISESDRGRLPQDAEDAYPLSRLQAGLHYHSETSPDYTVYLNSLHLRGRFEEEAMRKALDTLAARHPILRTSIDAISFSEPLQIVHRLATLPLKVEDLRDIPAAEREGRIGAWI